MATCSGWVPSVGDYPYPPANVMVMSSFQAGCLDLRWDDPSTLNTGPTVTTTEATATITVSGTPTVVATATGTLTVTSAPLTAGDTITISGVTLTGVAAVRTPGSNDFRSNLATVDLLAAEIAAAINDQNNDFEDYVTASASGAVVTLTAADEGEDGNDVTLATSTGDITLSGATLSGGADADTITIGGKTLTAVSGSRTSGDDDFSVSGTNFDIAESIADAVNDDDNSFAAIATASDEYAVVTLTAVPVGVQGNDIALSTTSSVITVSGSTFSGGEGLVSCTGKSNSVWNIVGVNVYRSDTGERGPYFRINPIPVGGTFYRDCTSNVLVTTELVNWETGWISKGDAANNRRFRIRTRFRPIVKREGQAIPADSPNDVRVYIDGTEVPVAAVRGTDGYIDLINQATYDPSTETTVAASVPASDGTSVVQVTYYRQGNLVRTDLDMKAKIHYRLTTVAVDPNGTTPSGLVETPLGWTPPVTPMNSETLDYIWVEAIRRNRWILEQGGERVKLFIRRETGVPCSCQWDKEQFELAKQPLNHCEQCYGTGYVGGYEGPIDLIIAPDDAEQSIQQTPMGRHKAHSYEVWTGPSPMLSQRDFIVKQNGERFSIGPVRYTQVRGVVLQQTFNIGYLDECDIRYQVPITGIEELTWPETRYTNPEDAPCEDSDPYPVGYDYQATTMATESSKISDGREIRGRTPVWMNLTYGGKGG